MVIMKLTYLIIFPVLLIIHSDHCLAQGFFYFDITLLNGFKQVFKAFTRGRTQLDRILTTFPTLFQDVQVSSLTLPNDHLPVICSPSNRAENLQKSEFFVSSGIGIDNLSIWPWINKI